MTSLAMALPVKPGKTGQLRALTNELLGARRQEFEASERRACAERLGHKEFVPWRIGPVM